MSRSTISGPGAKPAFEYKGWSLHEAIDALIAYDEGASDAGTGDEAMKESVRDYLLASDDDDFRRICAEFVRRQYLSDEAIVQGYGLSDVKGFIEWLAKLGIDI